MTRLTPEARAIVDAARSDDEPSEADRGRIRSSLILRLGAGFAAATVTTSAGTAAAGAAKATGIAALLGGVVPKTVVVVSAVGLGAMGYHFLSGDEAPAPVASALVSASAPAVAAEVETVAPPAPSIVAESESAEQDPVAKPTKRRPKGGATVEGQKETEKDKSTLDEELAALREAHRALRNGNADRAMEVLDDKKPESGGAVLAEERAAVRILSLCKLGRVEEARAEADQFLARWPSSPLAARVQSSCVGSP